MMVHIKVKIMVPLKYLRNFLRTLEMALINYETNLYLSWSKICFIVANNADKCTTFSITDTKNYIPVASR